jgi:hypothetical protein
MLSTIKICFSLYSENLKNIIKSDKVYDLESMDIQEIESEINIIHMKYILTSIYSISTTSTQYNAYIHMINMIEKYYKIHGYPAENNIITLDDDSQKILQENNKIPEDLTNDTQPIPKKGWFFTK